MKRRTNWRDVLYVTIMVMTVISLVLTTHTYRKREKLNQRYEESIEQLDIIIQKYVDLEPDLRRAIRKLQDGYI